MHTYLYSDQRFRHQFNAGEFSYSPRRSLGFHLPLLLNNSFFTQRGIYNLVRFLLTYLFRSLSGSFLIGDAAGRASDVSDDDIDEDISEGEATALREDCSADAAGATPAKAEEKPEDLIVEGKRRRTPVDYRILNFVSILAGLRA